MSVVVMSQGQRYQGSPHQKDAKMGELGVDDTVTHESDALRQQSIAQNPIDKPAKKQKKKKTSHVPFLIMSATFSAIP